MSKFGWREWILYLALPIAAVIIIAATILGFTIYCSRKMQRKRKGKVPVMKRQRAKPNSYHQAVLPPVSDSKQDTLYVNVEEEIGNKKKEKLNKHKKAVLLPEKAQKKQEDIHTNNKETKKEKQKKQQVMVLPVVDNKKKVKLIKNRAGVEKAQEPEQKQESLYTNAGVTTAGIMYDE